MGGGEGAGVWEVRHAERGPPVSRMETVTRILRGFIWRCGDPDCFCLEPRIDEVATNAVGEETSTPVWHGTFISDASSFDEEYAREELAAAAARHDLEPDGFDPNVYEREI